MRLLEIKNNLVKLSFDYNEKPVLGRFMVLTTAEKSYVAQFVNLKSDNAANYAIARLIFTFTSEGIVDNYDGSVPSKNSELSFLNSKELLDLLPMETPVKFGKLAQQDYILDLDVSIFENNFTIFVERDIDKFTFISNCVRQLFQQKEKCVIIDNGNLFNDYPRIEFAKDFKLPLNAEMIDFLFDYELTGVDSSTKAVIQDIFYAVQQYIKTLDYGFLPIDKFVDVVAHQYKETQMPELALLKNRLLKYRDSNVFANTKEEFLSLGEIIKEKNCSIINLVNLNDSLEKEVVSYIHKTLETFETYVYLFVSLDDDNSDKKFLKQFINHNHVFTTMMVHNDYKYSKELKSCAENIMVFSPMTMTHDFAAYNTFINKLNQGEAILFGKLTQGVPFIIDTADLELDLTKDDVLGDKYKFVPVTEDMDLMQSSGEDSFDSINLPEVDESEQMLDSQDFIEDEELVPKKEPESVFGNEINSAPVQTDSVQTVQRPAAPELQQVPANSAVQPQANIIEPVQNVLEISEPGTIIEDSSIVEEPEIQEDFTTVSSGGDIEPVHEDNTFEEELSLEPQADLITEDDLDFIEDTQILPEENLFADNATENEDIAAEDISQPVIEAEDTSVYEEEQPPVVPVFSAEEENAPSGSGDEECPFKQGDSVTHPRYGRGVVEKIIKYGNKTLCSISFENVGRRLLDPSISEFTKL